MSKADNEVERERQPYKQRELARAEKFIASLDRLEAIGAKVGFKANQVELVSAAKESVENLTKKLLASMPDDFVPPSTSRGASIPEVGDVLNPREDCAELYTKADRDVVVKEVVRHGGNAEGKGARFFLKVKRADGTVVTVPAANFE